MNKNRQRKLREQRERQSEYREKQKLLRKPSTLDMAKVALHMLISDVIGTMEPKYHLRLEKQLTRRLVEQGFDESAALVLFDRLVDQYSDPTWSFRTKRHLFPDKTFTFGRIDDVP